MALVIANLKLIDILTDLLKGENQDLKLFVNDITPAYTTVLGDFTEMSTHGYADITLTGSSWSISSGTGATAQYAKQTFTMTSTESSVTVYGYYVVNVTSGDLVYSERFANSQVIAQSGDTIKMTPKVTDLFQ